MILELSLIHIWEPVKDDNGNVTGYTASVTGVKCSVCDDEPKAEQITVCLLYTSWNANAGNNYGSILRGSGRTELWRNRRIMYDGSCYDAPLCGMER